MLVIMKMQNFSGSKGVWIYIAWQIYVFSNMWNIYPLPNMVTDTKNG